MRQMLSSGLLSNAALLLQCTHTTKEISRPKCQKYQTLETLSRPNGISVYDLSVNI